MYYPGLQSYNSVQYEQFYCKNKKSPDNFLGTSLITVLKLFTANKDKNIDLHASVLITYSFYEDFPIYHILYCRCSITAKIPRNQNQNQDFGRFFWLYKNREKTHHSVAQYIIRVPRYHYTYVHYKQGVLTILGRICFKVVEVFHNMSDALEDLLCF